MMSESVVSTPGFSGRVDASCSTLPSVPVYTERETRSDAWSQDPRLRESSYYIIDQSEEQHHNSPGRPYGVGMVTRRYADGSPFHFFLGHYYATHQEALLVAHLAEHFCCQGDHLTEECVLHGAWVYDLRARTAYRLLQACAEIADPPSCLWCYGNTSLPGESLPFQPGAQELDELSRAGGDWRAAWIRRLPPDPLGLLCFVPDARFPEIDWVATLKRAAATVAARQEDGDTWSHSHSINLLLQRFRIPTHWYLLEAALRRCVHESGGRLAFGRRGERDDRTLFRWRGEDPASFAALVPPCPCCGQPRDLSMGCGGLTYGRWDDEGHHRFMHCPFDGYGCRGGRLSFTCCSCSAIHPLVLQDAPVSRLEAAIAERLQLLREQGGTPFLSARE